ncbi:acyl CoA:acetate/3-ketoacid CoA transferase, partial [Bacillus cereus]|nr:acyl CoA:acetate/3-ketoacid CoA transferase [Bacillus cereus]
EIVKLIELEGEEWLFYKSFPIQVALIRGTIADENGNLTLEKEGLHMEVLQIAQAVRNSGGIVIAQVETVAKNGTLHPKDVRVPGILIDHLIISEPKNHFQTENTQYSPAFAGHVKVPMDAM